MGRMRSTIRPVPEILARRAGARVIAALEDTPVVVLNGPRQAGKSTLARGLRYPGSVEIVTLDDPTARSAAARDPRSFLDRPVDTLVIDEAQLEPRLFRAVKASVDLDRRPGRFLLTGSSRLLSSPDMADSLVGRVEVVELWPFSELELRRAQGPTFVETVFDDPRSLLRTGSTGRPEYLELLVRGGLPEAVSRPAARRRRWFESYVATTTERVVREVADIERLAEIPRLLRLCAARTATELNLASLASELGMAARTASGYLAHLATAFLVQLVPAWSTNLSAKVVRRPKLLVTDVGLAAHLAGVTLSNIERPTSPLGPLLETFVVAELRAQAGWGDDAVSISHFRDRSGVEVDIVLEHADGRVVGVEVKATSTPVDRHLRGLRFLADRLGDRFQFGVLLHTAPESTPFGPALAALPISSLWSGR